MRPLVALPVILIVLPVIMNAYSLPLEAFTKYCRGGRDGVGPRRWSKLMFLLNPPNTFRGAHLVLHYSILGAIVALWAIRRRNFRGLFSLSTDDFPAPAAEIRSSWQYDHLAAAIVTVEILVTWLLAGILCYACFNA